MLPYYSKELITGVKSFMIGKRKKKVSEREKEREKERERERKRER